MVARRRPGNREHDGGSAQEPGQGDLSRRDAPAGGNSGEWALFLGKRATRERRPGDEGEPVPMAEVENVVRAALREAVAILDRDDRNDRAGACELPRVRVRHAHVPDLALGPELAERTH